MANPVTTFHLPKYFSNRKSFTVMVVKTGMIGKVVKCRREKDIYYYRLDVSPVWFAEFELKNN